MKILLLHSLDGQDYARPIGVPDEMSFEDANAKADDAIRKAQCYPNDWTRDDTWDDTLAPLLRAAGFLTVEYDHGPIWDD